MNVVTTLAMPDWIACRIPEPTDHVTPPSVIVEAIVGLACMNVVTTLAMPDWIACRIPEPTDHVTPPSVIVEAIVGSGHAGSEPPDVPAVVQRHVEPAKTAEVGMTTAVRE